MCTGTDLITFKTHIKSNKSFRYHWKKHTRSSRTRHFTAPLLRSRFKLIRSHVAYSFVVHQKQLLFGWFTSPYKASSGTFTSLVLCLVDAIVSLITVQLSISQLLRLAELLNSYHQGIFSKICSMVYSFNSVYIPFLVVQLGNEDPGNLISVTTRTVGTISM